MQLPLTLSHTTSTCRLPCPNPMHRLWLWLRQRSAWRLRHRHFRQSQMPAEAACRLLLGAALGRHVPRCTIKDSVELLAGLFYALACGLLRGLSAPARLLCSQYRVLCAARCGAPTTSQPSAPQPFVAQSFVFLSAQQLRVVRREWQEAAHRRPRSTPVTLLHPEPAWGLCRPHARPQEPSAEPHPLRSLRPLLRAAL